MANKFKYLIIGGGMTASAAVESIRTIDKGGTIGLISAESYTPYDRPPLSKGLWQDTDIDDIWRKCKERNVEFFLKRLAVEINPSQKMVIDQQDDTYSYEKLLLATGGTPRRLPFGDGNIIYYRTLADYKRLRELADRYNRFAVIGGGFIGAEIAAALAMNDKQVTMIFPQQYICQHLFPAGLANYVTDYYREKGVEVLTGEEVTQVKGNEADLTVVTMNGREIAVNGVVAGIGIEVTTELAETAGLTVDNGIVVDKKLRTSHKDIFAAGDVVVFFDPFLKAYRRVEHEDNALTMGGVAGYIMAGDDDVEYNHSPMFYSDMFDLGYEAIGEINSGLETVEDWQEKYKKGVVYYLQEGKVYGVLLWNVWGQVPLARDLIASAETFKSETLKGKLG
ncbi:MAG: FAD-dependent oxidoreductase [Anaerolineae bacterium]|nr:FAD-dependent oxidoreductase [Anaerolineae bacterium]